MSKQKRKISNSKRPVRQTHKRIEDELITIDEWIERYGRALGINNSEYVRQMCRGNSIGQSKTIAHLPEEWLAKKIGCTWVIFRSEI